MTHARRFAYAKMVESKLHDALELIEKCTAELDTEHDALRFTTIGDVLETFINNTDLFPSTKVRPPKSEVIYKAEKAIQAEL